MSEGLSITTIEGILSGPWVPVPVEMARETHEMSPAGYVRPVAPRVGFTSPFILLPQRRSPQNPQPVYSMLTRGAPGRRRHVLPVEMVFAVQDLEPPRDLLRWMRAARGRVEAVNAFITTNRRAPRGRSYRPCGETVPDIVRAMRCPWNELGVRVGEMGLPPHYEARRPDFVTGF